MKKFSFKEITICSAMIFRHTRSIRGTYSLDNSVVGFEIPIINAKQFEDVKEYLGIQKDFRILLYPPEDCSLLLDKHHTVIAAFTSDSYLNNLLAIGDLNGENFYHLHNNQIYAKDALISLYN